MRGKPITKKEITKIKKLRETGHSLPEICKALKRGNSTVYRFIKDIVILPEHATVLREKQGGSKKRAEKLWQESDSLAKELLKNIQKRDKLLILASIYWGEGTKKELGLINSDPTLIKVFISCLKEIGVKKQELRISLRIYNGINISHAKKFWAEICGINVKDFLKTDILQGKKTGKLPYGMCRIRVVKSGKYFKLIMSMIRFIKLEITKNKLP